MIPCGYAHRHYKSIVSVGCLIVLLLAASIFLSPSGVTRDGSISPEVLPLSERVECNREPCNGASEKNQPTTSNFTNTSYEEGMNTKGNDANLQQMASQLDPSYRNTMAKLGTDLEFNIDSQCPAGSYMLDRTRYSPPQHTDCPTLFIVGARKGGTTSLYQYVSKHPDFHGVNLDAGAKAGELFYFNRPRLAPWEEYRSIFRTSGNAGTMTGESTVAYLVSDSVPKRLYRACGKQAKIVMLLRDPVKRMESNWLMRVSRNKTQERQISAVTRQELSNYAMKIVERTGSLRKVTPDEWSKLVGLFVPTCNMLFEGLYYIHLLNWLCNFPAENVLILNSEEFFENPSTILDIVFQFLGLRRLDSETYESITALVYNKGKYDVPSYHRLSQEDVRSVVEIFKPFSKRLLELLQWDSHKWLMMDAE